MWLWVKAIPVKEEKEIKILSTSKERSWGVAGWERVAERERAHEHNEAWREEQEMSQLGDLVHAPLPPCQGEGGEDLRGTVVEKPK